MWLRGREDSKVIKTFLISFQYYKHINFICSYFIKNLRFFVSENAIADWDRTKATFSRKIIRYFIYII